jgi:tRNA pseudouridine38-40 synthase
MRTIKLTIAYDGTDFNGWQSQPKGRTIQQTLEGALSRIHDRDISVVAAGRTDAGVHATGQVAAFRSDRDSIPIDRFAHAINSLLPLDVRVLRAEVVRDDFHARFDATCRTYEYHVLPAEHLHPTRRRYTWRVHFHPNIARLNQMCLAVIGEHDFASFAGTGGDTSTTIRRVYQASWRAERDELIFHIAASGFLWRMVRSLVGTMIGFERDRTALEQFEVVRDACNREAAGESAPARGLYLCRVEYPSEYGATEGDREGVGDGGGTTG